VRVGTQGAAKTPMRMSLTEFLARVEKEAGLKGTSKAEEAVRAVMAVCRAELGEGHHGSPDLCAALRLRRTGVGQLHQHDVEVEVSSVTIPPDSATKSWVTPSDEVRVLHPRSRSNRSDPRRAVLGDGYQLPRPAKGCTTRGRSS